MKKSKNFKPKKSVVKKTVKKPFLTTLIQLLPKL